MSYVFQRVNGTKESRRPLGNTWPRRHTLMVMCTTTGNLRECLVKRPRQWLGHDSAPLMGPFTGVGVALSGEGVWAGCWCVSSVFRPPPPPPAQ